MRALYLHKRDFRFFDNEVLNWLNENLVEFAPVYIWEPSLMATYEFSDMHQFAVAQSLDGVRERYARQGVPFIEYVGEVVRTLDELHEELGIEILISHMEHGTEATFRRDIAIKEWCRSAGVRWIELPGSTVKRGLKSRDDRIKVWNDHMAARLKPVPKELIGMKVDGVLSKWHADQISEFRFELNQKHRLLDFESRLQPVTEKAAHDTLQDFLNERSVKYRGGISSPNSALTHGSRLSVHLAWGTLSVRCVYKTAKQKMFELQNPLPDGKPDAGQRRHYLSLKSFTARLHWRDHFIQRLEDQPDMPDHALNPAFENIEFLQDQARLHAWLEGRTGEPMIDACMRCLQATGFINFRMRSMCLSYGVYGLHLDWRALGRAMAEVFYDYEPGIHWSQVQMQAGVVGINTIRVYSPDKQLLDQDPDCKFVKHWIPELSEFTAEEIKNYRNQLFDLDPHPMPIVPFKEQSASMKKLIYGIKNGAENRKHKEDVYRRHGSRFSRPNPNRKVRRNSD
jgi:deoxyribodipyrimidine photo-lyase